MAKRPFPSSDAIVILLATFLTLGIVSLGVYLSAHFSGVVDETVVWRGRLFVALVVMPFVLLGIGSLVFALLRIFARKRDGGPLS